jgi:hypothetical protein
MKISTSRPRGFFFFFFQFCDIENFAISSPIFKNCLVYIKITQKIPTSSSFFFWGAVEMTISIGIIDQLLLHWCHIDDKDFGVGLFPKFLHK